MRNDSIETARSAYGAAISLMTYEGNLIWAKYNAMLVANSIILSAAGISATPKLDSPWWSIGLALAGLLITVSWFLLTKRGFDNYVYWIFSARELEESYLRYEVKTLSRGGNFADGKTVNLKIDGKFVPIRMSYWSRKLRAKHASYSVLLVFSIFYLIIFVCQLLKVISC